LPKIIGQANIRKITDKSLLLYSALWRLVLAIPWAQFYVY
jgi:hypothetical protein